MLQICYFSQGGIVWKYTQESFISNHLYDYLAKSIFISFYFIAPPTRPDKYPSSTPTLSPIIHPHLFSLHLPNARFVDVLQSGDAMTLGEQLRGEMGKVLWGCKGLGNWRDGWERAESFEVLKRTSTSRYTK